MKDIRVLNNNIIHVDGAEFGEVSRERDQIDGGLLVELVEIRVTSVVNFPS